MFYINILIFLFFTKLILCDLGDITYCDNSGFFNNGEYIGNNYCTTKSITNAPTLIIISTSTKRKKKIHKTKFY